MLIILSSSSSVHVRCQPLCQLISKLSFTHCLGSFVQHFIFSAICCGDRGKPLFLKVRMQACSASNQRRIFQASHQSTVSSFRQASDSYSRSDSSPCLRRLWTEPHQCRGMPSTTRSSSSKRPRRTCTLRDDERSELSRRRSPSPQRRNPVETFWSIPELIAGVMDWLPSQALYECSLVSRSISSLALDALWAPHAKIQNLLRILAPLVPRTNNPEILVCYSAVCSTH